MTILSYSVRGLILPLFLIAPILAFQTPSYSAPSKGLYDDDTKDQKTGDLADQDYWFAKFDANMLELALKQRQPEGRIGLNLVSSIKKLDELVKKYPKHEEIKKWRDRALEIQKKINPDANRNEYLNPNCPWEEANYAQLWVNFNLSKMLYEAKNYEKAKLYMDNVMRNYDIMLKPDRMKEYPEDLSKWVTDHKEEADKMYADIKKHLNRR